MHSGVSMIYSAYLLAHQQECKSHNVVINVSAYMNKRFILNLYKYLKKRSYAITRFKCIIIYVIGKK